MNKKLFYTQPTTDLLELRVEHNLLQASKYGQSGAAGLGFSSGNINDLTGDDDF